MKLRPRPLLVTPDMRPVRAPKVALGYPYGSGMTGPFVESLLNLQLYEGAKPDPLLAHRIPQSGLYIDHNRNRIVEKFMTTTDEWLLQIDTDIEFPKTLVETLVALAGAERRILAASVPLGPPLPSCAWMMTEKPGIWEGVPGEAITEEGIRVDGLATAVILIHREVFEKIADTFGQCWFLKTMTPKLTSEKSIAAWGGDGPTRDREFVSVGEDLAFCMKAGEVGFACWCAKVPGLKHHKTLPMSHDYEAGLERPRPDLTKTADTSKWPVQFYEPERAPEPQPEPPPATEGGP